MLETHTQNPQKVNVHGTLIRQTYLGLLRDQIVPNIGENGELALHLYHLHLHLVSKKTEHFQITISKTSLAEINFMLIFLGFINKIKIKYLCRY